MPFKKFRFHKWNLYITWFTVAPPDKIANSFSSHVLTLWRHRASITNNTWSTHDIECTGSHVTCIAYTSLSDVITRRTGSELCTIRICSTRIVQVYFSTISWVIFIVFLSKINFIDNWKVTSGTLTSCTDDVTRAVSRDGNTVGVVRTGIKQATSERKSCFHFSNSVDLYKSKRNVSLKKIV